ncbi:MAG: YaaL family protein [Clostridiales bacterium]|nr:YaaL family protein [Clostridiales bacterium]
MKSEEHSSGSKGNISGSISTSIGTLYSRVFEEQEEQLRGNDTYANLVHKAHEDWQNAESFFHSVSDPDLIDFAVYNLDATKSRYIYLLKKAKEERKELY